ncbi:MAG: SRPBCC family protein [Gemmatimonadaceae bacterium]
MHHTDHEREHERAGGGTSLVALLGAAGVGAALAYYLDPDRGVRRRNMTRDRLVHGRARAGEAIGTTARDLGNRARGLVAETRGRFGRHDADEPVLVARVRTALGRVASHPRAIEVAAENGEVTLSGLALREEAERILDAARAVPGVTEVYDSLELHDSGEGIPALQGGVRREPRPELAQENWAPAMRLVTGVTGSAIALWGFRRRGISGVAARLAGAAMVKRAITNLPLSRLTGVGAGRRAIDVQKAITVQAPVERVYAFFTQWDNWPRWMSHVREVRSLGAIQGQDRTHWVVDGPAGTTVTWDAVTTALIPNEQIAWKSIEGAAVEHAGVVRFARTADGATTIDVKMTYNPPAGAVGHAVASILGRDPKHQMDDDLARLKTTIETGTPPRDAARAESTRRAAKTASSSELRG